LTIFQKIVVNLYGIYICLKWTTQPSIHPFTFYWKDW
jgi:hypothetical protein